MSRITSVVAVALLQWSVTVALAPVRTPLTQQHFAEYRKTQLPPDFDVVDFGGWYELEKEVVDLLAQKNFERSRPNLPSEHIVVRLGGWDMFQSLAADPKGALLQEISRKKIDTTKLQALVALLTSQGKGFEADLIDGEWASTWFSGDDEKQKKRKATTVFDIKKMTVQSNAKMLKSLGDFQSKIKYLPVADNFDFIEGKLVLRRIVCESVVGTSWKFWKLPRIPLLLSRLLYKLKKERKSFMDILYLDQDMCITNHFLRGKRQNDEGRIVVHTRE